MESRCYPPVQGLDNIETSRQEICGRHTEHPCPSRTNILRASGPAEGSAVPGAHSPVHAALQVGHGALPARRALVAALAETLHEALLEGAALPCNNTPRGPR